TFIAKFGDNEVFHAELGPGISANPYISFQMRVPGPGTFEFAWIDDNGAKTVELTTLDVA
ncbi:MAG TPA: thiosulfate oxidation carrier complex protein SoxZ, partial [Hyphomicrobium sp.]|nr:thiosulfate oxidation carrier complex protein SoxZ [Hyphomicrobium sp.]